MLVGNVSTSFPKCLFQEKEVARDTSTSEAENRKKEKSRREKPKKRKVLAFKLTEIQSALKELKSSGWLRQEKFCPCGDKLVQCPLRKSVKRGTGRVYLRCAGCRRWYDVVAFSSLPVLKMPLPLLLAAMKRYFQGPHAEGFARCAEALGMSGTSKTCALARLWNALRTAEQRCMDHTQSNRVLTGLEMAVCFERKHTVDVPIFPQFQGSLNVHSKQTYTFHDWDFAMPGDLEVDATTVRKWRDGASGRNMYYQIFGVYKRRYNSRSPRPVFQKTTMFC